MGFSTALSGLNAASNMLSVTGNNIANVNTVGFKKSRSEFGDVYAALGGSGKSTPGAGVVVANDSQQFGQGNLESTGNQLDLGINGDGFFVLGESIDNITQHSFTRAGMFHADQNGYVVANSGQPLLVYKPNGTTVQEGFSTGVFQPLQLGAEQGQPQATHTVSTALNLDSRETAPDEAINPFVGPDAQGVVDVNTYNRSSSVTIYDSLGNTHIATSYFVKQDPTVTPNTWTVYTYVDGKDIKDINNPSPPTGDTVEFDTTGKLVSINGTPGSKVDYTATPLAIAPDADPLTLTLDLYGSTQVGSAFSVNSLSQDGLAIGKLTSLDINDQGVVFARFSNGASRPLGQVALARFPNPQGLSKLGDTKWAENTTSGAPIYGVAATGSNGSIKAGALETSNVDLSGQLVNLIVAQQAFQANAQTITTENEVTRTLLQIR